MRVGLFRGSLPQYIVRTADGRDIGSSESLAAAYNLAARSPGASVYLEASDGGLTLVRLPRTTDMGPAARYTSNIESYRRKLRGGS